MSSVAFAFAFEFAVAFVPRSRSRSRSRSRGMVFTNARGRQDEDTDEGGRWDTRSVAHSSGHVTGCTRVIIRSSGHQVIIHQSSFIIHRSSFIVHRSSTTGEHRRRGRGKSRGEDEENARERRTRESTKATKGRDDEATSARRPSPNERWRGKK